MSRIRLLSEHLANQIAAGEVVERPASVVKELLENSLDAGATRISIQTEGNGTRLIRIRDNGEGMDADDVLLSIERHATSKIQNEQQLAAIATLGFRGEALPSIGSVSNLIILSRLQGNATGTKADIRYGRLHGIHEDGCSQGTIIEVRNLFGNVPARRKFLKSGKTELFHIEETVRNLALAHPETEFLLQDDQRTILHLMPANLEKRVRDIFHYQKNLLPLTLHSEHLFSVTIQGFLLLPDSISSSRTSRLRTLVNDRPVQDNMVRRAVSEGLQGFLMKGQQPAGALLISIDPEQVDVNVHPAKREIRFRNAQAVFKLLQQAATEAVRRYQDTVRTDLFAFQTSAEAEPLIEEGLVPQTTPEADLPTSASSRPKQQNITSYHRTPIASREQSSEPVASSSPIMASSSAGIFSDHNVPLPQASSTPALEEMTLVGQLFNLYLLYEKDEQMIIIDQHAAHERILYQELRKGYLTNSMPGQNLMFPVTVELLPEHVETIEKYPEELAELGLTVEHFGDATWIIKSVPAMISHLNPKDILPEILDTLLTGKQKELSETIPKSIDTILASMACKAAIKAGNKLTPKEMTALLIQMGDSEFFSHCPHGRPVIKIFARNEIEKWFHRL